MIHNYSVLKSIIVNSIETCFIMTLWGMSVFPAFKCKKDEIIELLNWVPTFSFLFLFGVSLNKFIYQV
jgi:hypothetical protein